MNLKLKLTLSNYSHLQLHIQEKERLKHIGKPQRDTKLPQTSVPKDLRADKAIHKEWVTVWKGLSLLYRWQSEAARHHGGTPTQTRSERVLEKPNEPPLSEGHTSRSGKGRQKVSTDPELLEKMLNLHLKVEEESTMAFELIKFIKSMLEEGGLLGILSYYCQYYFTTVGSRVILLLKIEEYKLSQETNKKNSLLSKKKMDLETAQTNTTAKLPLLKQENGNSFKLVAQTTTNVEGTSTTLVPSPVTADEKTQKKNDVKARSMLLMALPNEHLLTLNQSKDAKTLFAAIQARFGGNEAIKKTQKTLLKQMYENFSAPSTESLDSIFNMLQKIVSQLAILGENISQEDLNLKFLRSLPSEWNNHVVVWRNKPDLDTTSFDDLYNNFKIVEQEVKGTANSSSSSSSQNMAFMTSPSSTNDVNTAYEVSTANTQVSTASTQVSTANLSDATVYAFLSNQPNGSQLVHEDLEQIHEDDLEEMDLKWQLALLSMRTRRFF
ncbi:hypothetical protein Tco_0814365 [Tanacetum coccineum]